MRKLETYAKFTSPNRVDLHAPPGEDQPSDAEMEFRATEIDLIVAGGHNKNHVLLLLSKVALGDKQSSVISR